MKKTVLILIIILVLIGSLTFFTKNKKGNKKDEKLCIKNKNEALDKIKRMYKDNNYNYESHHDGIYVYTVKKDDLYKEYIVNEKTCEVNIASGHFYKVGGSNE